MGRSPLGNKPWNDVAARILSAKVQIRAWLIGGEDAGEKRLGVAACRLGREAGAAGSGGGSVAHADGALRQGIPFLPQATGGGGPGFGCEDDGDVIGGRPLCRDHAGDHERADDGAECGTEAGRQFFGKAIALRGGAGEEDGRGLVLRGHVWGVTPAGTLRATDMTTLTFLGIESSCDDSAAAIVRSRPGQAPEVLSSVVQGQTALHAAFGGVVPEIAARAHAEKLDGCVERALDLAGLRLGDVDGVAVTAGPGLIGGVLSGVMLACGIAIGAGKPLVGVNHLAGHALTPRLTDGLAFPYLMLLVSGGHCQFLIAEGVDRFHRLGGTIDDAPGEAFDKTAKLLGLPQPGGPSVEAEAAMGDAGRFIFPRPLLDRPGCDLSFSGLKTALLRARDAIVAEKGGITVQDRRDLCAGFQAAVAAVLAEKTRRALLSYLALSPAEPALAVAGGVAANRAIRAVLETVSSKVGVRFIAPPLPLCTDNAAMIAWAGIERFRAGLGGEADLVARPRWPLDSLAAPMIGSGKKGAKA